MQREDILVKPILTEKSMALAGKGKFTFAVIPAVDKTAIKKAVEAAFKVKVIAIGTSIGKGRSKRTGNKRIVKKLPPVKKAVVTLEKGQKIDLFETGA